MAVELTATDYSGVGIGVAAVYGTGIYANTPDQIKVYVDGVLQTLGDNYSIVGTGSAVGVNVLGTFPGGSSVYVERVTPVTQLVDTQNNETILEDVLDAEFDKLTMIAQEAVGKLSRALLVPKGEIAPPLPPVSLRANKFAAFDGSGALVGSLLSPGLNIAGSTLATSRIALANLNIPSAGQNVWLSEFGRSGMFEWRIGNFASAAAADPYQAIYVPSVLPGFGAEVGCWVRSWDGVTGYGEWAGAVADDPAYASTNVAAFNSVLSFIPDVVLKSRYWVNDTIIHNVGNHRLRGVGFSSFNEGGGFGSVCGFISTNDSATILQVGLVDPLPVGPGLPLLIAFPQGIAVENVSADRAVPPRISSNCIGVRITYMISPTVRNMKTRNSMRGYQLAGLVGGDIDRTYTTRDLPGAGSGTDYWTGYEVNGTVDIGTVGGNASLFIDKPNATCNQGTLQGGVSYGMRLFGQLQDLFIRDIEAGVCNIGMFFEGGGSAGDIRVEHPVLDACATRGLLLQNIVASGAINITDPYVAMAGGSTGIAIHFDNCAGPIGINGGQVINGSGAVCLAMLNTTGAAVAGLIIQGGRGNNLSTFANCESCRVQFYATNTSGVDSIYNLVLVTGALTACVIEPSCGGAGKFGNGIVTVVGTDVRNTYRVGGINSSTLTGGYTNKLVRNTTNPIDSPTKLPFYSGTNLVEGCTG